ncbi:MULTISPECIES: chemotaxis protein [unclassified Herbaspirillum]|jgi:two-component system chemotaxis response regulator CheV|uniref:chemotaxis protein n=1 Tax=unclassified Herbaspirillum TaxID=2624150 RepID=UPI000E2EFDC6|nr:MULTISPECIES: chemotaxis protein [unclassified Herbaspirillum]RFB69638.1 chemotaxis protein CheV [Herbaspirillum sp. 3R-3a1]TFI07299.1 chemotaxis signal transduction protein CheV [Herbaspirillum sp. 3R11]TFI12074.1 chemotaxis signal transduction protein CheV [Herbaspirillum sp. 3R-11]TFI29790.1 chemotaxis signal transduction protein CheV [Herbaspirillum sp. 3C11]
MDAFQKEIDERTNLTASNKFELLLFRLGNAGGDGPGELFGINVFKIREIVPMVPITTAAGTKSPMLGMVNIRGQVISVIDLPAVTGCKPKTGLNILLITEYARNTQAFAVESVEEIVRLDWSQVLSAEASAGGDLVTSIARLDSDVDGSRLVQVLDVEQILNLTSPVKQALDSGHNGELKSLVKPGAIVLAADDSKVARALIEDGLTTLGVPYIMTKSGKEAWEKLQALGAEAQREGKQVADKVALMLTDLEMPEMDGFTLTRNIKADQRYKGIPVVIHSSLSGSANEDHVRSVGANGYVAKFAIDELAAALKKTLMH